MRAIIQRVSEASVTIEGEKKAEIGQGYLVLLGIESADKEEDADWLAKKIATLRVFGDEEGNMNLDLDTVNGEVMVISQFTLHAKYKKGTRPSFIRAAKPDEAIPLYKYTVKAIEAKTGKPCQTGEFGADMKVGLVNDGPVTIFIDTQNKE